jgi:predicted phosphodiesterase
LLVHGSPTDPGEAMSHDLEDEELMALVGDDPADVIVCGMSHVPFDRTVSDVRIINVGSVGEAPGEPPVAHATWIDVTTSGVSVEQFVVPLPDSVIEARRAAGP